MEKQYITVTFKINGMTCVSCENRIERKLKNTKDIANAVASYGKGTVLVTFDRNSISRGDIARIIEELGYEAVIVDAEVSGNGKRFSSMQVAGIFVILIALYLIVNRFGVLNFSIISRRRRKEWAMACCSPSVC
jgi:copper chaperone CopZ